MDKFNEHSFDLHELEHGDLVYTPDEVFGSGGKKHNIFVYDERINYSLHFGHEPKFYKLKVRNAEKHAAITKDVAVKLVAWITISVLDYNDEVYTVLNHDDRGNDKHINSTEELYDHFIQNVYKP